MKKIVWLRSRAAKVRLGVGQKRLFLLITLPADLRNRLRKHLNRKTK